MSKKQNEQTSTLTIGKGISEHIGHVQRAVHSQDMIALNAWLRDSAISNYGNIPPDLRSQKQWLVWKASPGSAGRFNKIPYYANGSRRHGRQGSPEDLQNLVTGEEALKALQGQQSFAGIGFAATEGCGFTFVDIDSVLEMNSHGQLNIKDAEAKCLAELSYSEVSPSGKGLRIVLRGETSPGKNKSRGIEVYTRSQFLTMTGNAFLINGKPYGISDITPESTTLIGTMLYGSQNPKAMSMPIADNFLVGYKPKLGLSVEAIEKLLEALDPDMDRDNWIRVGMALDHECEGDDTGFALWDDWSSGGTKYTCYNDMKYQWNSFLGTVPGRPSVTMASVIAMTKDPSLCVKLDAGALSARADDILGIAEMQDDICTPEGFSGKYPVTSAGNTSRRKAVDWFIKGLLPKADLIVLYGASGSGKSFVALDMMATIARGIKWRDYRVKKAAVVIVAAEGGGGFSKRINAYCQHHGIRADDLKIGIIDAAPNVLEQQDIEELVLSLKAVRADIVVIDTFAQVTPGANENSGEDMGRALRNLRLIREATGATILLVHHAGKDATRGSRGWSGIKAAADTEIEISGSGNERLIKVTKMKDGEDSLQWGFRLNTLIVGADIDGDPETSCVVEYFDARRSHKAKTSEPRGEIQRNVLRCAENCGAYMPDGASMEEVIDRAVQSISYDPADKNHNKPRDQRRAHVTRALNKLCDTGKLSIEGDRIFCRDYMSENANF